MNVDGLHGSFSNTSITSITLPENIKNLDGCFSGVCIQRLTVTATGIRIHHRMLEDCPNLQQLVFLGGPPITYDELFYGAIAMPTIYYLAENKEQWAPNGETTWNGLPMMEIKSVKDLPDVTQIHGLDDRLQLFGWVKKPIASYKSICTVATDAGWKNLCKVSYPVVGASSMEFGEGVTLVGVGRVDAPTVSTSQLKISSTVQSIHFIEEDRIGTIELSPDNPYFHMDNGKLIETTTGKVVWQVESDATVAPASASAIPMETSKPQPTLTMAPTSTPELEQANEIDGTMLVLGGCIFVLVVVIIVLAVKRKR